MKYNSSIHHPASMNNKRTRAKTVRKSKDKSRKARNARATRNARAKRTDGFNIIERIK